MNRVVSSLLVFVWPGSGAPGSASVLYMADGSIAVDFLHISGLVQICVSNGTMRPFIFAGIENTERCRDLTGPTENEQHKEVAPVRHWHYERMPEEKHSTIFHPAALKAFRAVFGIAENRWLNEVRY